MKTSVLNIEGMGCSGCVETVESSLIELDGVQAVKVELDEGKATVDYDPEQVNTEQFEKAVDEAGYSATAIDN